MAISGSVSRAISSMIRTIFFHLLHVLRVATEDQHVEPVEDLQLHRIHDPGKIVAELGRPFAETRSTGYPALRRHRGRRI